MPTKTSRSDENQGQGEAKQEGSQTSDEQSQTHDHDVPRAQSGDTRHDQAQSQSPSGSPGEESGGPSVQPASDSNGAAREPDYYYDPVATVRAELVRLADDWQAAGGLYQAIAAYTELLVKYPDTGAAAAATEGLVNIAREMKRQGRYYMALGIFKKLEALV